MFAAATKEPAVVCEERKMAAAATPSTQSGKLPPNRTRGEQQAKADVQRNNEAANERGEKANNKNKAGKAKKGEKPTQPAAARSGGKGRTKSEKAEGNLPSGKATHEAVSSHATPTSSTATPTTTATTTGKGNLPRSVSTESSGGQGSEDRHVRACDPPPDEAPEDSGWTKASSSAQRASGHAHEHGVTRSSGSPPPNKKTQIHTYVPADQIHPAVSVVNQVRVPLGGRVRGGDGVWPTSSQECAGDWVNDEFELDDVTAISRCSTDDDKLREFCMHGW